jgi:hypothetical protein
MHAFYVILPGTLKLRHAHMFPNTEVGFQEVVTVA